MMSSSLRVELYRCAYTTAHCLYSKTVMSNIYLSVLSSELGSEEFSCRFGIFHIVYTKTLETVLHF